LTFAEHLDKINILTLEKLPESENKSPHPVT